MFVKHSFLAIGICIAFLVSCSSKEEVIDEGTIIYSADYPNHRKNIFLYNILPKEVEISFQDGKVRNDISRGNFQNIMLFDCNQKQMDIYFQYGEEAFKASLSPAEIRKMRSEQTQFTIRLTDETDTLAGFNVKKALAVNKQDQNDVVTLWYTEEIQLKNPNWYNTFNEVPGVLLAYSVDRFGIRMDYKATKFIPKAGESGKSLFTLPAKGTVISYDEYNKKMNSLFATFD